MAAPHSSQTFLQLAGEQGVRQLFSVLKEFPILCESSTDSVPEKKQAWLKVHDVYHRRFQANLIERIPQEKIKKQWSTILANTLATGCSNKWGDDVLVFYHFNAEERKQIDQIRRSRGLDNCQFVCAKTVKEIRDIRKMRQFISMLSSGDDPGQASSSRNKQGNNALEAGANPLPRRAESVAGHARGGVQQVAIHTPPAYPNPVNQQNPHVGASQRTTPQNVTVQQSRSASALSHGQGQRASPYPQMVNRQTVDQTMQPQLQPQVQQQQQRLMNPAQVNQAQVQAAMPQVSVAQNPKLRGHPPTQQLSMPRTTLPEQLQAFQISPGQMMQSIPTGYQPVQQGFMPGYNPQMQQQIANPTQAQIQQQVFSHAQMQRPMNSMQLPQNRNPIEMQQQMNQVQLQQMMIRQARNSSQLQQPVNSAQNYMNQTQLQQQVAQMQRRSPLVQPANPQQMMNSIQMQQMVQAQGQQARNSSQLQQPVNSTQQYMNQVQLQHQVAQMQQSRRSPLMQQPANPAMNPAHVQQAYGQARAQQQATQPGQATSSAYLQHHAVQQLQQQSFPPQTEMSNPGVFK
ncbi:hypothetical protein L596_007585 [Steinernema carpocapsae]|uniref:Uncharacterized protein n=1 Tax=Steinernema carpocapsae TaxID=34508 RepID=A0A4U5PAE1_STECR|nr:hypothetical protein L596_007585 [Steinernema carpocapsae]